MSKEDFNFQSVDDVLGYIFMYSKKDDYGSFLTSFILTWQTADPFNKQILKDAAVKLIKKYHLEQDAQKYKDGTK